jgi:hypothetical protein
MCVSSLPNYFANYANLLIYSWFSATSWIVYKEVNGTTEVVAAKSLLIVHLLRPIYSNFNPWTCVE